MSENYHQYNGINTPVDKLRIVFSLCLLVWSITLVMTLIATGNTRVARDLHPAAAGCILWACIIWMSMVEGGQASMVGLPPIDREFYSESHPKTYKMTGWGHKGNNLDRYLLGRQFLVVCVNYTISLCGAPLANSQVFGLPNWLNSLFLDPGLCMVLMNVMIGQLTAQVNASHCMQELNSLVSCTLRTWSVCCATISLERPWYPSNLLVTPSKTLLSGVVVFGLWVSLDGLSLSLWKLSSRDRLPCGLEFLRLLGLSSSFYLGLLEAMQIALFTVAKMPKSERGDAPLALQVCECVFGRGGKNLPGFMMGRQMTVTFCFFSIARVTTIQLDEGEGNIFGVADWVQKNVTLVSLELSSPPSWDPSLGNWLPLESTVSTSFFKKHCLTQLLSSGVSFLV
jgi:hypothetical protein